VDDKTLIIKAASSLSEIIDAITVFAPRIELVATVITKAFQNNKKVLMAGNGGSAAEATHIAAEFTGRFKRERKGWPAISLATDQSAVTAIANDYGYEKVFARQIEALGNEGDVLIVLSTSGNSENLLQAINEAQKQGVTTMALLGKGGGRMKGLTDIEIVIPSDDSARIQEAHLHILHVVCELVENQLTK
jgi:D-sedoheptulose 7-phosphate isomerase